VQKTEMELETLDARTPLELIAAHVGDSPFPVL